MPKIMNEETVTISKKEYISIKKDSLKLEALEQGGVDNWDWYGDSLEKYEEWLKEMPELNNA